jgi:polyhydroxyalkanoate synthesis repressor PhaR
LVFARPSWRAGPGSAYDRAVIVKKYGNRRLYDTEDSRYVRLGEIAAKIRSGVDVRIVDAQSDADLTAETLVQIIFEDRHAARLLPVTLLQQMIRMGDDALADFLGRYVSFALELYLQAKGAHKSAGLLSPFSALAPLSAMAAMPLRVAANAASAATAATAGAAATVRDRARGRRATPKEPTAATGAPSYIPTSGEDAEAQAKRRDDDVADLRRELDELKKSLKKKR